MLINCSICIEDINLLNSQASVLNCGHLFHADCLSKWLDVELNCPECRNPVIRGAFAEIIYPKPNQETACQLKSLEKKCKDLQSECEKLKNEVALLKIKNLSLKKSEFIQFRLLLNVAYLKCLNLVYNCHAYSCL